MSSQWDLSGRDLWHVPGPTWPSGTCPKHPQCWQMRTQREREREIERERGRERERFWSFGISLWHIDKHGVLLTVKEREREIERERFKSFIYCSNAWTSSVFYWLLRLIQINQPNDTTVTRSTSVLWKRKQYCDLNPQFTSTYLSPNDISNLNHFLWSQPIT